MAFNVIVADLLLLFRSSDLLPPFLINTFSILAFLADFFSPLLLHLHFPSTQLPLLAHPESEHDKASRPFDSSLS